jgi:hypothetical protein
MRQSFELLETFGAVCVLMQLVHFQLYRSEIVGHANALPAAINAALMITIAMCGVAAISLRIVHHCCKH